MAKMFNVYFLKSLRNGKIYIGSTKKPPLERLKEHNLGGNDWTKNNRPFKLIYYETYLCEEDAKRREQFYKTGFGKSIKKLIIEYIEENITGRSSDG